MKTVFLAKYKIIAVFLSALVIFLVGSLLTYHPDDIQFLTGGIKSLKGCHNCFGYIGACVSFVLFLLFGLGSYSVVGLLMLYICKIWGITSGDKETHKIYFVCYSLFLLGLVILLGVFPDFCSQYTAFLNINKLPGGLLGKFISDPTSGVFYLLANLYGCLLFAFVLMGIACYYIWLSDWAPHEVEEKKTSEITSNKTPVLQQPSLPQQEIKMDEKPIKESWLSKYWKSCIGFFSSSPSSAVTEVKAGNIAKPMISRIHPVETVQEQRELSNVQNVTILPSEENVMLKKQSLTNPVTIKVPTEGAKSMDLIIPKTSSTVLPETPKAPKAVFDKNSFDPSNGYQCPPLNLLAISDKVLRTGADPAEIESNKQVLQETLASFKIPANIGNACSGPRVTLYEVIPEEGVKVERISSIQNNIAMKLCAESLRILAPIPGKGSVGIEVPNRKQANVLFYDVITSEEWKESKAKIPLILGRGIDGRVVITDLAKAPHLLIAGATGTGKSVCISALLMSMLFKFSPEELRLILVDPKTVEFTPYHEIPHLVVPVITENEKVSKVLRWAINEMERRYRLLAKVGCRQLESFNSRVYDPTILDDSGNPLPEKLPFIVIVIDELADIMMTAKAEVETSLARIAQKSRAVGIHTILATQRPSVNVITGVIKANFPARIAFKVASAVDSQTILNGKGAESLLGSGDSLFSESSSPVWIRSQGAFISDQEIANVTSYIAAQQPQHFDETVFLGSDDSSKNGSGRGDYANSEEDALVQKAIDIIRQDKKASISYIQRRLSIGYNKAATIMEELEDRGLVGPQKSTGTRDIFIDEQDF